jgi:hypothetical protein
MASENRVLRRIFETTTEKVTGGYRKLHNDDLHHLYSSLSKYYFDQLKEA